MSTTVNMFSRAMLPFGPLLTRLPLPANRRFLRARALLLATVRRFIDQRRRQGELPGDPGRPNDLLSVLLHARDNAGDGEQEGMTDQQLLDECMTIFAAGHETTANALTFTWYLLARHPRIESRLHEELDRVLAGKSPTAADVPRLTYTRAILAESMRLYPPAWAIARRPVLPYSLRDHTLPAGAVLLMSQWVVHRDPRWWPDPLSFNPDRWLNEDAARPRHAYFPFGGGPRQCIGESFAWMEATLILATLAQQYRLELPPDAANPLLLRPTITLRPKDPLPMIVHLRPSRIQNAPSRA
jgi:cytochrome P450